MCLPMHNVDADIFDLPESFLKSCRIAHKTKCKICVESSSQIRVDSELSTNAIAKTIPWFAENKIPQCVWSLGSKICERHPNVAEFAQDAAATLLRNLRKCEQFKF